MAYQYYQENPSQFLGHLHRFRLDQMTGVDITASSGRPLIKNEKSKSWSKTNYSLYGAWIRRTGYATTHVDAVQCRGQ